MVTLPRLANRFKSARKELSSSTSLPCPAHNYQKQHSENTLTTSDQQFIELQLPRKEKTITLQKVELLFDNHKCCIEGKLGSSQLLKLVELIEEAAAC